MSNFTFDEINLMCIYNTGTRAGLMQALTDMRGQLEPDEAELLGLTDSALRKLGRITDEQFAELEQTKLESAAAENLTALEDCMTKEQTLIMRMKGLEQERARWMTQNGKEGLTFRALLEQCDEAQRKELQPLYDQLSRALLTLEDISKSVQQIIRTNLYVVNRKLEQQGQGYHKDGSAETTSEGRLTDSKA